MSTREERIERMVERCGYGAAALTILPIPGSEVIGVMPLHVGMVIGIGNEYGQELTRESAVELITQIGGTVGLSLVGSHIATTAGKVLLPGLGGLIAAPFMYASTLGIGHVARLYFERGGLSKSDMKDAYDAAVKTAKRSFDPRKAKSASARKMAEDAVEEGESGEAAEGDSGEGASARATPKEAPSVDELAERLAKLEELHDKGLISDGEYERKREAILDEI